MTQVILISAGGYVSLDTSLARLACPGRHPQLAYHGLIAEHPKADALVDLLKLAKLQCDIGVLS